ncbi:rhodanese-like domain-containing protein [Streptosporangium sp. NPDC048865]|uniref:rhodanese-like domain-containing protein n=1 Tax=Streptosporangium sp. NPDC048865 TaxID=3155766 RepID=UPI003443A0F9
MEHITREGPAGLLERGAPRPVEALPVGAFVAGHIPGARNVPGPLTAELAAWEAPDRAAAVAVHCPGPSCDRSEIVAASARRGYADVRVHTPGEQDRAKTGPALESGRAGTVSPGRPA